MSPPQSSPHLSAAGDPRRPFRKHSRGSVFPSLGCGLGPSPHQRAGSGCSAWAPSLPLHQPPESCLLGTPQPQGSLQGFPDICFSLPLGGGGHNVFPFLSPPRHPQCLICHQTVRSRAKVTCVLLAKRALVNTRGGRERGTGAARLTRVLFISSCSVSP